MRRMADPAYREQQWSRRFDPNIAEVNQLCESLVERKPGSEVPFVDPVHDVDECRIVSLFASPGPGASSRFISTENDDETAARTLEIYEAVGLRPEHVMPWNAYPWFVFDEQDGKLTAAQISEGLKPLLKFLRLVPRASALVAHGGEAQKLADLLLKSKIADIQKRGFKTYKVRALGGRAFAGKPADQQKWLDEAHAAYTDAMARAGLLRTSR